MAAYTFKTTFVIYASPDDVFEALTDPGIIAAWGGGLSVIVPKVGGHFELFDGWVKGEVTHFVHGKELGYTWKPSEWDKRARPSEVHMRLMPHAAGTEIVLAHSNFPSQEEADKHANGWIDYVFDPMNDYFTMKEE